MHVAAAHAAAHHHRAIEQHIRREFFGVVVVMRGRVMATPNIRSKTNRGLISEGSGVVGVLRTTATTGGLPGPRLPKRNSNILKFH
jgi:hypothetical protein